MKTYKQLVGEAMIKAGLGFMGGGLYSTFIKEHHYLFLVIATLVGALAVHFGALLAQEKKDDNKAKQSIIVYK